MPSPTSSSKKRKANRVQHGSFRFPVIIEKDRRGYFAACPVLQGCYTQGSTYEEALDNIEEAISLHVEDRMENGEAIPISEEISFTTVEIQI
ncbi:MAG TPA: type II toxin-antitoxin system HicB family antitoxin [Gemmataceae bacterium]|jgi:predicted RNase H-like HicB family nuclease|nr:type II toxin-antitoxin system HicB family antitoxin [Gemmataceae bacterium]